MNPNRVAAFFIAFSAAAAPAIAAETTDRNVSVPDAIPACMDRNGPDCVLKSEDVTPRVAAPPIVVVPPVSVPPVTAVPADTSGNVAPSAMRPSTGLMGAGTVVTPSGNVVSPSGTVITPGGASTAGATAASGPTAGGGISTPGTATTGSGTVRR